MSGSLYQRNGVWYLLHHQDALNNDNHLCRRRVAKRLGKYTRERAEIEANKFLAQAEPELHPGMTVRGFVTRAFLPQHVSQLKKGTQRAHRELLRLHILPVLGEEKINEVRTQQIQKLIDLKKKLGRQSKRHIKHCCGSLFETAIRAGVYHGVNPVTEVVTPTMTRKPRYALTIEQIQALTAILPTPACELMLLGCTTSLGRAELLALRYGAVNLTKEPVIYQTYSIPGYSLLMNENYYEKGFGTPKTSVRERIVPLADIVVERLIKLKEAAQWTEPQDIVFVSSRRGIPLLHNDMSRRFSHQPAGSLACHSTSDSIRFGERLPH